MCKIRSLKSYIERVGMTFEVGYTPNNLRLAIEKLGVTQAALAATLGVSDRTLRQWLVEDLEAIGHRDMPLKQWRKVLELLEVGEA